MEKKFKIFIEQGIIMVIYKSGLKINLVTANEIVNARLKISNGKTYPLLIDGREMNNIDRKAREYFNSEAGRQGITAVALLAGSTFTKYIGNFYLKITDPNPAFPAKLFTDKIKALLWLEQYKNKP